MQKTVAQHIEVVSDNPGTLEPGAEPRGFLMLRGLILPLSRKEDFVLGRDKSQCDIVLAHEHISKQHAIISFRSGRYFIRDLGSLNGTFVNGERVNGIAPLVAGDEIRLPPYMMLFFGPDQPMAVPHALTRPASSPKSGLKTEQRGKQRGSISGLLSILSVTDIIQLVNFTSQSGILTIRTPEPETAVLTFSRGEIVQARYAGKTGEKAVHAAVAVKGGEFEFVQGEPPVPESRITRKTMSLLLEGSRLMDEAGPNAFAGNLNADVLS